MKKLFYLIVIIVILGLIVPGCIPVVPPAPAEQSEPTSLTRNGTNYYVRTDGNDNNDGSANDATHAWATITRATDPNPNSPLVPGDTLHIADGTYTITSRIWVKIAGITITGNTANPENVKVQYSPTANDLIFDMRASNVTIEGIKTISGKSGFYFDQSATGCTISHCIVENTYESGVYIYNGSGHTIEYTTIINPGQMDNLSYSNGIYTRAANTTINHCTISSDKVQYMKWGVNLEAGSNHVVTETTITGAWQAAIRVASGVRPVTITNNDIDDATEGYSFEGAISLDGNNDGSVISGNHIDNVVSSSAIVVWPAWDIRIANNQIGVDDTSKNITLEGIRVDGCGGSGTNRVEIIGNTIHNTGYAAVLLINSDNAYVYNNIIKDCNNYGADGTGDWDYASIHVDENSDNVIIDNNDISDGINGIQVWGNSCTVTNNTVTDMGLTYDPSKEVGTVTYWNSGIIIGGMPCNGVTPTGITVEENTLTGNVVGLFVYHASNEAHLNNIEGNTEYGVYNAGNNTFNATRNWWGSPTGPNRELPNGKWVGKGDKVGSNIDYKPWSPQPVEFCNDLSLTCTTIQDGILLTSDGRVITTGYDEWGYDYQAHMFNGYYCDAYRDAEWCHPWRDVRLMMCWNDAWLSSKDCDGDGLLDRHYGYENYIGSGAWLTNHQSGEYEVNGEICKWNYFVKIVAAPSDAYVDSGYWYTVDGTEIGPVIWGAFAIIQQVENDPCAGISGLQYSSPCGPGLGKWEGEF